MTLNREPRRVTSADQTEISTMGYGQGGYGEGVYGGGPQIVVTLDDGSKRPLLSDHAKRHGNVGRAAVEDCNDSNNVDTGSSRENHMSDLTVKEHLHYRRSALEPRPVAARPWARRASGRLPVA